MSQDVYLFLIKDNIIIDWYWLGGSFIATALDKLNPKQLKNIRIITCTITKEQILKMYKDGDINYVDSPEQSTIASLPTDCKWQIIID